MSGSINLVGIFANSWEIATPSNVEIKFRLIHLLIAFPISNGKQVGGTSVLFPILFITKSLFV